MAELTFEGATPILRVADFDRAVDYYVHILGFALAWRVDRFGCVRRGEASLMLSEGSQGSNPTWVYVAVSDADAYFAEVSERGARIRVPPTNYPWRSRELHVFDADGNVLRFGSGILEGEPFGAWLDEDGARWLPTIEGGWKKAGEEKP